jgi:hypothetical protein
MKCNSIRERAVAAGLTGTLRRRSKRLRKNRTRMTRKMKMTKIAWKIKIMCRRTRHKMVMMRIWARMLMRMIMSRSWLEQVET